jgi:glycine hydroxymethyltransferase
MIPFDTRKPLDPSGIRLGTPALTTRGCAEGDMKTVGDFIDETLAAREDDAALGAIREKVKKFSLRFPVPGIE